MTTLQVSDEPLPQVVAARLRGLLAERKISHKEFGELVGWNRGIYQRRLSGEIPLDLSELEHIERITGITVAFLLTGIDQTVPPPTPPGQSSGFPNPGGRLIQMRHKRDVEPARNPAELLTVDDRWSWYAKALAGESDDGEAKSMDQVYYPALPAAA